MMKENAENELLVDEVVNRWKSTLQKEISKGKSGRPKYYLFDLPHEAAHEKRTKTRCA